MLNERKVALSLGYLVFPVSHPRLAYFSRLTPAFSDSISIISIDCKNQAGQSLSLLVLITSPSSDVLMIRTLALYHQSKKTRFTMFPPPSDTAVTRSQDESDALGPFDH